mgnify:CR=1 FL=1
MNKKIKIGLFALIILGTITLCLTYKSDDKIIKTKKRKQNNLAIMIKEDGATDYTKSNSKDIPKGDYVLNRDKSYCKNNGKIGNYDSVLGKVSFSFIGSDSCYLYFDYKEDTSLYGTIKKRAKTDTTYLALYTGEGADTYANPVYYYKGNVQNNNVLFGGFCWKIVRTTETGGVKMVYNGVQTDGSCNNTGVASQLASTKAFNSSYNSPAYVGYMYNTVYTYSSKSIIRSASFSGSKIVGDSVTYSGSTYTLNNTSTLSVSSSNIGEMVGKYTCNSSSATSCSRPYYIVGYRGTTIYYYSLSDGNTDGTSYSKDYVFGKSFTYANGTYTLSDTVAINSDTWINNISSIKTSINTHHYTCFTDGTTCTSIYYIYYIADDEPYYITLTNGKSVDDALNEMLYADDVNKTDSTIKAYIDSWYKGNMTSYTDKLEDTVFCNDRTMYNQSANGWNPNGGSTTTPLEFKNYSTNYNLACTNETDRFSMSNSKAKLTYPVGLLSAPEVWLAYRNASYSTYYLKTGKSYWLASPNNFADYIAIGKNVYITGSIDDNNVINAFGTRPAVSLKPGTVYASGDGSYTNPFVIGDAVEEPSGNSFDTVFAANNTDIFPENGLRYEGADPNNYICLDNKKSGTCSDSSLLFRIIGLFDEDTSSDGTNSSGTKKLLKIIDTNNYGGTSGKVWNSAGTNNWSTASLKTELNGPYLTTLLGTSNVNSKLSSAIANAKWHLGGASSSNYNTLTAEGIYKEERNASAIYSGNPSSIYAKVGLMYPSDYGYATVGGTNINKSECRTRDLYDWDGSIYSDCRNNDWLFISQNNFVNNVEWTITPRSDTSGNVLHIRSTGNVSHQYNYIDVPNFYWAARPTFYLDSSILKIVGGTGTSDNAYRIG